MQTKFSCLQRLPQAFSINRVPSASVSRKLQKRSQFSAHRLNGSIAGNLKLPCSVHSPCNAISRHDGRTALGFPSAEAATVAFFCQLCYLPSIHGSVIARNAGQLASLSLLYGLSANLRIRSPRRFLPCCSSCASIN
jgi:hypothetical protein